MNEISKFRATGHRTTQGAEGLPRYKWSVEQFDALAEHGFIKYDDRVELVGGELVPMSPKGNRHEIVRQALLNVLFRMTPNDFMIFSEPGWRPNEFHYLEPDFLLCATGASPVSVVGADVLLLIEVSDTSASYDGDVKSRLYAALGVREYWVVNAKTLETIVHLEPSETGYGKISTVPPADTLAPLALPALAVSLGALKIG